MTLFKKLHTHAYPVLTEQKATEDSLYWQHLQFPVTIKQNGAVSSIDFSPVDPFNYLVCSSTKVQLFSPHTCTEPLKSYHRFTDVVHSATFRDDGQLFVVACEDKQVRVVHQKHFEQVFHGHTAAVHVSRFVDRHRIYSASDDRSVRVWDIATTQAVNTYQEHTVSRGVEAGSEGQREMEALENGCAAPSRWHNDYAQQDYVRCGSKASTGQLFAVGSYDKSIRLFDPRCSSAVMVLQHLKPLEAVLLFPAGNLIASAGGTTVKLWDVVAGGRMLAAFSNHHKTITSLSLCMHNKRLVSASLDRHVKMYDLTTFTATHSIDYEHPLLTAAFPGDDSVVVVGSTDGMLTVRVRRTNEEIREEREERRRRKRRMEEVQKRSKVVVVDGGEDVFLAHQMRQLMPKYETRLKKFQHSRALDEALHHQVRLRQPEVGMAVLKELRRRRVLGASVAGRSDKNLSILLTFLLKNFKPPHVEVVSDALSLILDLYEDKWTDLPQSLQVVCKMQRALKERLEFAGEGLQLVGVIESLVTISTITS